MHQVASDLNKSKREPLLDVAIADWSHRDCLTGDNLQQDIFKWLSPPDPWKNHHIACKSRHRGSAEWFIQDGRFSAWKTSYVPSSFLWVHGKRALITSSYALVESKTFVFVAGAGKSVFWYVKLLMFLSGKLIMLASSTIIEDIDAMRKTGQASLAFFYCEFREDQKKDLRGLLSSFLVQLCHQSDSYCDILSKLHSDHAKGLRSPSDDSLVGCLMDLLKLPRQAPVYLIVDALDECPESSAVLSPRVEVLNFMKKLVKSEILNLRICVTSRPEIDIKDVLGPLIFYSVSLHDERGQKQDIKDYIKSVIHTHRKNQWWKAEHMQLAINVLTEKSNGM